MSEYARLNPGTEPKKWPTITIKEGVDIDGKRTYQTFVDGVLKDEEEAIPQFTVPTDIDIKLT